MALADVAKGIARKLAHAKQHHGVPVFELHELGGAIEAGLAQALTYSQLSYVVKANSTIPLSLRHDAIDQLATAIRSGHPHVYKLKLTGAANKHLAQIKSFYATMLRQVENYLNTGTLALAAKKNGVLSLDVEEREKLKAGILIILVTLKMRMDGAIKPVFADAYRRGKEAGVAALSKAEAELDTKQALTTFDARDASKLRGWYEFHNDATQGLIDDIGGRILAVIAASADATSQAALIADVLNVAEVEAYRLPMYSWSSYSVAEDGQKAVFEAFNLAQRQAQKTEWKYAWITAGDQNVCPICESYGAMKPKYLDQWDEIPGDVHVYCRCDWLPIPPEA